MICLAQLNKRVEILTAQRSNDNVGGGAVSWSSIATVWASIKPRHMSENLRAEKLTGQASHTITLRYRPDIQPNMRFGLGTRQFEIISQINVGENNVWLECLCTEMVP